MRAGSVMTAAVAAILVLAGCASAEEPTGPQGPNGYTASASFDDGSVLWWDRSPESGMTDLVLTDDAGRILASCLSAKPLYCVAGPEDQTGVLVIAPAGAERAVMQWFGEEVELERGELGSDAGEDALPVFAGVMPEVGDPDQGYHLDVLDGAGETVFSS
ncbi:hypothetical protein [Agrococcus carbonis]|uniref:Lipoprotein n=1 Tax=Agrococcus carbonis TaxID=684552 RepID=A0A1H1M0S6_9MICO|nr:hypothetical protein [Agrococcus carbonis]SDR80403.1 hypothetical protein SAMN04489719_0822 [Agrococcus carbonis]